MLDQFKKILVLAPHTDDGELGCGGTIAKLIENNKEVFLAVFSKASAPKDFSLDPDIVLKELKRATEVIGMKSQNLLIYDYPVRYFPEYRQNILEEMRKIKEKINPNLVLTPSLNDIHQDHQVVANESLRVFKDITVLGYEEPWNNFTFRVECFVHLSKKNIDKKISAIEKYKSQNYRPFVNKEFIMNLAKVRGLQGKSQYAEAFEVIRLIIK